MMRAEIIAAWAAANGIDITKGQLTTLASYQQRVLEVNAHMNLTAITDTEAFAVKHFIDSLTLIPWIPSGANVMDIGAGAGFPGVPLAVARPDIRVTLLDSLRKRILFLQETTDKLAITNTRCIHARAEEIQKQPAHRGSYAICTARAVARLETLVGYAMPLLKQGGLLLAMKGPEAKQEIEEAKKAAARHGGELVEWRRIPITRDLTHSVAVYAQRRQM